MIGAPLIISILAPSYSPLQISLKSLLYRLNAALRLQMESSEVLHALPFCTVGAYLNPSGTGEPVRGKCHSTNMACF